MVTATWPEIPAPAGVVPDYFPVAALPDPSQPWEHLDYRDIPFVVAGQPWQYLAFFVPPPADKLIDIDRIWNAANLELQAQGLGQVLFVALWYRADRVGPVPTLWFYHLVVGYGDPSGAAAMVAPEMVAMPYLAMGQGPFTLFEIMLIIMGGAFAIGVLREGSGFLSKPIQSATTNLGLIIGLTVIGVAVVAIVLPQLTPSLGVGLGGGPVRGAIGVGGAPPVGPPGASGGLGRRRH